MKDWKRSPEPPSMMGSGSTIPETLPPLPPISPNLSSKDRPGHGSLSLQNMCKTVIVRNLASLEDIGDIPYRTIKDILGQCKPDQLRMIERNSPQLQEESDELWFYHCIKDFSKLKSKYESRQRRPPKEGWRTLYLETSEASKRHTAMAAARVKEQYASHNAARKAKKVVVETTLVGPSFKKGRGKRNPNGISIGGIKSKGQSILQKARSESKAAKRFTEAGNSSLISSSSSSRSKLPKMKVPRNLIAHPSGFRSSTLGSGSNSSGFSDLDFGSGSGSFGTFLENHRTNQISPTFVTSERPSGSTATSPTLGVREKERGNFNQFKEPESTQVKSLDFFGSSSSSSSVKSPTVSTSSNKRKAEETPLVTITKKRAQTKTPVPLTSDSIPSNSISSAQMTQASETEELIKMNRNESSSPSRIIRRQSTIATSPTLNQFNSNPVTSKAAASIFMPRSRATSQISQTPRIGRG